MLLKSGANYNAKSRYGDDALQMACLKGSTRIFNYLITYIPYSPEQLANAHELMGATFLDEDNDLIRALYHWKEALVIREANGNKIPHFFTFNLTELFSTVAEAGDAASRGLPLPEGVREC